MSTDKRIALIVTVSLFLLITYPLTYVAGETSQLRKALLMEVSGFVGPAIAEYIENGIRIVNADESYLVVILTIDTYGGSLDSTLRIIRALGNSRVPVIGFVYPHGASAYSAGTYVLMATDYAVMAPYTKIGACQPISATGTPINESKIINPLIEEMEVVAKLHKRNETQAIRFITHNDVLGPEEALKYGVIEDIADTIEELLAKAHNKTVYTVTGEKKLYTLNVRVERLERGPGIYLLTLLQEPTISSLLLSLGILLLFAGILSPGWGAEVAGLILLILGLIGSGFNVNYGALALIVIGSAMLVYELVTPHFGIVGLGGIATVAVGLLLMITNPPSPILIPAFYYADILTMILLVVGGLTVFFGFVVYKVIQARKAKPLMEKYLSREGVALDELGPNKIGFVLVGGEYWRAKSMAPIKPSTRVRIVGEEGGVLIVEEKTEEQKAA